MPRRTVVVALILCAAAAGCSSSRPYRTQAQVDAALAKASKDFKADKASRAAKASKVAATSPKASEARTRVAAKMPEVSEARPVPIAVMTPEAPQAAPAPLAVKMPEASQAKSTRIAAKTPAAPKAKTNRVAAMTPPAPSNTDEAAVAAELNYTRVAAGAPATPSSPGAKTIFHFEYYPQARVYQSTDNGQWFWFDGKRWNRNANLPDSQRNVLGQSVTLEFNTNVPYLKHKETLAAYPASPSAVEHAAADKD
jgi:hypothetical protein